MSKQPSTSPLDILVVDDEPNIRKALSASLSADDHRVVTAASSEEALQAASRISFDLALVDLKLGADHGIELLQKLRQESPWLRVIIMTAYAGVDSAVQAIQAGAIDYLAKPFSPAQLNLAIAKVAQLRSLEREVQALQSDATNRNVIDLESKSPAMSRAIDLARQVASSDASILLRGESGTGKGVLAKAIHQLSPRAGKPLVTVPCPSLSEQLLESELFGHVKGAFTGAVRDNAGRIAAAAGGTLFLDEIGDLPLSLQPKLLRFLQDREYERVGESTTRRADVRIITATNVNLEDAVQSGRFRQDLYYRLNVIQIDLPPLRDRLADLPVLAKRVLIELGTNRPQAVSLSPTAEEALLQYHWPGNVRELRNVLERAIILSRNNVIEPQQLLLPGLSQPNSVVRIGDMVPLEKIEELHIRAVLSSSPSIEEAARVLGMDSVTLWRRRKKYGLE